MNVCTPSAAEQAALQAALAKIVPRPVFGADFEVARGRTTGEGGGDWVRLRREFRHDPALSNVQFLLTAGERRVQQKLVFHARASRPGEVLQVSLESESAAGVTARQALDAGAAPGRIRLERFGALSLVLVRCAQVDQAAYAPLFRTAAERFAAYTAAMGVKRLAAAELDSLRRTAPPK